MPRYDLQCEECGHQEEVSHGMSEPHPDCSKCGGRNAQQFNTVPGFVDKYSPLAPRRGRGKGIGYKSKT